jgi:hypothetical protein
MGCFVPIGDFTLCGFGFGGALAMPARMLRIPTKAATYSNLIAATIPI